MAKTYKNASKDDKLIALTPVQLAMAAALVALGVVWQRLGAKGR